MVLFIKYKLFIFQLIVFYITKKLDTGNSKDFAFAVQYMVKMVITSFKYDNKLLPDRGVGKVFDQVNFLSSDGPNCNVKRHFAR